MKEDKEVLDFSKFSQKNLFDSLKYCKFEIVKFKVFKIIMKITSKIFLFFMGSSVVLPFLLGSNIMEFLKIFSISIFGCFLSSGGIDYLVEPTIDDLENDIVIINSYIDERKVKESIKINKKDNINDNRRKINELIYLKNNLLSIETTNQVEKTNIKIKKM